MLKADGPAVRILWSIDCSDACVTAAVRTREGRTDAWLSPPPALTSCPVFCNNATSRQNFALIVEQVHSDELGNQFLDRRDA